MMKEARLYNGEKAVSLASGTGKAGQSCVNQFLEYILILYTKRN